MMLISHHSVDGTLASQHLKKAASDETRSQPSPIPNPNSRSKQRSSNQHCYVIPIHPSTPSPLSPAPSLSHNDQQEPFVVPPKSSAPQEIQAEPVLADLLFTLRQLRMTQPDRHREAVERLRELEQELREAGAVCPPDPAVAEAVARALASATPGHDLQIRVNQSRHTTTTKTVYETETPGMLGLSADHIRTFHRQMLDSLASGTTSDSHVESGTTQKRETAEEGFTDEDGALVVSKRMTRLVTTTRSALPGESEAKESESPTESLGSVKDRIAIFESIAQEKETSPPKEIIVKKDDHLPVEIIVTPMTPTPRDFDEKHEETFEQKSLQKEEPVTSEEEVEEEDEHGNVRRVIRKKRITEKYTRTEFHIPGREGREAEIEEVEPVGVEESVVAQHGEPAESSEEEVEEEDEHGNVRRVLRKKRITEKYTRTEFHIPGRRTEFGDEAEEEEEEEEEKGEKQFQESPEPHLTETEDRQEKEVAPELKEVEESVKSAEIRVSPPASIYRESPSDEEERIEKRIAEKSFGRKT
ncbi:unnamed protein product, partial [Mesorhabditis belari]|uniref:Uncharacterized protein n=1 Tax=Mesorhabditis belari TaxID=2138241 RepID=A0AAF3FI35_9BILA